MSPMRSVGSRHLDEIPHSVTNCTCATLNSTALSLDFFSHKIENLSNPPAGFEAESDTDCVQTLCNL